MRTKGSSHSDLTGWREVERKCGDVTITDTFLVLAHTASGEDSGGNCYDWYEIDKHYRETDRTSAVREEIRTAGQAASQVTAAAMLLVRKDPAAVPDGEALKMPDLFLTWAEALEADRELEENTILNKDGKLFRVVQKVQPEAWRPPDGEGMLALYRPIIQGHAGTREDPIPWTYGMDCSTGLYYRYELNVYLCKADMKPCVWAPGTAGLWQWELAGTAD